MYAESMRDYAGMPMVELSEDEFVEIYRIRQLLEPEAAFLACKNATPEDIANLEQLFAEHEAAVAADPVSPKLVHKCNRAFHFVIVATGVLHTRYAIFK